MVAWRSATPPGDVPEGDSTTGRAAEQTGGSRGQAHQPARGATPTQNPKRRHTVDGCEIHFAPPFRNPGMIRFLGKYQQTMVSTMVSWVVQEFVHPQ